MEDSGHTVVSILDPYLGRRCGFLVERGSSLHRKPPQVVAIYSLEGEPQTKLAGPLSAIHTRYGSKVTIADIGL